MYELCHNILIFTSIYLLASILWTVTHWSFGGSADGNMWLCSWPFDCKVGVKLWASRYESFAPFHEELTDIGVHPCSSPSPHQHVSKISHGWTIHFMNHIEAHTCVESNKLRIQCQIRHEISLKSFWNHNVLVHNMIHAKIFSHSTHKKKDLKSNIFLHKYMVIRWIQNLRS